MRISARLETFGYLGTVSTPSFHVRLATETALASARKRTGALNNVRELRTSSEGKPALILSPNLVFPLASNDENAWTSVLSDNKRHLHRYRLEAYLDAVGHESYGEPGHYINSMRIGANESFCVRAFLPKPDSGSNERPIWTLRWDNWQFQIIKGRAFVMRLSAGWSQAVEDDLNTVLKSDEVAAEQVDFIAETRQALYSIYEDVGVEPGGNGWYDTAWTLTFLPEPSGALNIALGEGAKWQTQTVELPEIIRTRREGMVWNDSKINIRSNKGMWYVQLGYPRFPRKGELRNGRFKYLYQSMGDLQTNIIASRPPSTDVNVDLVSYDDAGINREYVVTLSSSHTRRTPYFYAADVTIENGPLPWESDVSWDSAELETDRGPIRNVRPALEGDMRRSQYELDIRDLKGRTLNALGNRNEFLENRIGNLYIGGTRVITNGLIKTSQGSNRARGAENLGRAASTQENGSFQPLICDGWAILEERLLVKGELIGDGLRLGEYVRRGLKLAGYRGAQIAGVPIDFGRVLPVAAFGESYAIESEDGESIAEIFRRVIDDYGMGVILWQEGVTGVWRLGKRTATLAKVEGHEAVFKCTNVGGIDTYPARFTTKKIYDVSRDTRDFFNQWTVQGADDADGIPIVYQETLWESVAPAGSNTASRLAIGRLKPAPVSFDSRIRTMTDAMWIARSLGERYGRPPRFHQFDTWYHKGLFPGDRILIDGVAAEITRIDGDIGEDRCSLSAQEIF